MLGIAVADAALLWAFGLILLVGVVASGGLLIATVGLMFGAVIVEQEMLH